MNAGRIIGATAIALCLIVAAPLQAQDKGKDKPKSTVTTKVLLENDKVRVTETTFKPGDVSAGDRRHRVGYALTGGTLERTNKEGKKSTVERKAGAAAWQEADSDVVRNIGKSEYKVVTVTLK